MAGHYERTEKDRERARLLGLSNRGKKSYKRTKKHREAIRKLGLAQKGRKHTEEEKRKIGLASIGRKHNWIGDKVGIPGMHDWLRKNYGSANHCENKICKRKSIRFDWAKLRGKPYKRRRNHFIQLCRGCHIGYDRYKHKIKI